MGDAEETLSGLLFISSGARDGIEGTKGETLALDWEWSRIRLPDAGASIAIALDERQR